MARTRNRLDRSIEQVEDEQARERAEGEKDRTILLANYKRIMQDRYVRALLWEILGYTGFFTSNANCDNSVFFTEGKRSVGEDIIYLLAETDETILPNMMLERKEDDHA